MAEYTFSLIDWYIYKRLSPKEMTADEIVEVIGVFYNKEKLMTIINELIPNFDALLNIYGDIRVSLQHLPIDKLSKVLVKFMDEINETEPKKMEPEQKDEFPV